LIDLGFLVGDSTDNTLEVLSSEIDRLQNLPDSAPFGDAVIVQKDFGAAYGQNVDDRHAFAAQAPRRKLMGRARNYLLYTALRPDHSWVYWRDVDMVWCPPSILQDFMSHDKDILVPSKPSSHERYFLVLTVT
jgi:hypothetical protein